MEEGDAMNKHELEQIDVLNDLIDQAKHIVFFGGAGVSTESGIPDFRGTDGLYHQKYKYDPETILNIKYGRFFHKKTGAQIHPCFSIYIHS